MSLPLLQTLRLCGDNTMAIVPMCPKGENIWRTGIPQRSVEEVNTITVPRKVVPAMRESELMMVLLEQVLTQSRLYFCSVQSRGAMSTQLLFGFCYETC